MGTNKKQTCKDCIYWGGRTDTNFCKLKKIRPCWYNPNCDKFVPIIKGK